MKQSQSEKYNIAWFKLAECVARGEKERALGVFRLLSHSFDDSAFARQLEGDIFLVFRELENAKNKYLVAAELYEKEGRVLQATAVYEHLLTLDEVSIIYRKKLLDLYLEQKMYKKVTKHAHHLIDQLLTQRSLEKATQVLEQLEQSLQLGDLASIHEKLFFTLISQKTTPHEILILHGKKTVDFLSILPETQKLPQFLAKLEMLNEAVHDQIVAYINGQI